MRETVDNILRYSVRSAIDVKQDGFLWPKRDGFELRVRIPEPDDPRTMRSIPQIPAEEIELAFKKILEEALSMPREFLVIQVARVFGAERLASESQRQLEQILDKLISEGEITDRNGRLMRGAG